MEHLVPIVAGGESVADNLALACFSCNRRKWDRRSGVDASATDCGKRSRAASIAGAMAGSGSVSWPCCTDRPIARTGSIGTSTTSTPPSHAHTSTRLVQKGGPGSGGPRPQSGRLLDQTPHSCRRRRQATRLRADRGPAARHDPLQRPDGSRRCPPAGPWPSSSSPPRARGRQGLQHPRSASLPADPRDPSRDRVPTRPAPLQVVRSRPVPNAQHRRTPGQPVEAVPPGGDALREARFQLLGDGHARGRPAVAVGLRTRPSPFP